MNGFKWHFLEMWSKGQGIRYLHFSDVPDYGGTLTFDLLKITNQDQMPEGFDHSMAYCVIYLVLLPSFYINLNIHIYVVPASRNLLKNS